MRTHPSLGVPSIQDMLTSMLDTLTLDPTRDVEQLKAQREAAASALACLMPRDALEAQMACRIVTAHYGAMDCFRRASLLDVSDDMAIRLRASGASLSRLSERTFAALERRHGRDRKALPAAAGNPFAAAKAAEAPPQTAPSAPDVRQAGAGNQPAHGHGGARPPAAPVPQPAAAAPAPAATSPVPPVTAPTAVRPVATTRVDLLASTRLPASITTAA